MPAEVINQFNSEMDIVPHHTTLMQNISTARVSGDKGEVYKIRARRKIISEVGLIEKGQIGFVTKSWVQKAMSNNCSCSGSLNWFEFL